MPFQQPQVTAVLSLQTGYQQFVAKEWLVGIYKNRMGVEGLGQES